MKYKNNVKIDDSTSIGDGNPCFFIAEVASAHEGNYDVAMKMIDCALAAKADAVKFQFFNKEAYMVPYHHIYPVVEQIEFSVEQWTELRSYAEKKGILFIADVFDLPSSDLAMSLDVDAMKIHSSDLTNPELIEHVSRKKKPIFLGVGATTMEEITSAIHIISKFHNSIILMHGYQAFPTCLDEINFKFIKTLKSAYNLPVGFLDHTEGETFFSNVVPLLAPLAGADVIEKHFTLDRSKKGIDYESSVNPDILRNIAKNLRLIESTIGDGLPKTKFSESEQEYRDLMKKTIVANEDIHSGKVITKELIAFKRAGPGLRPMDMHLILGKKTKKLINQHSKIKEDDLEL